MVGSWNSLSQDLFPSCDIQKVNPQSLNSRLKELNSLTKLHEGIMLRQERTKEDPSFLTDKTFQNQEPRVEIS